MIDAGTILQKMKKQTFRYVICFAAEGLYLFENDDIGHRFEVKAPPQKNSFSPSQFFRYSVVKP